MPKNPETRRLSPVLLLLLFLLPAYAAPQFAGSRACAACHTEIAESQAKTRMAQTWQGTTTTLIPPLCSVSAQEGPGPEVVYRISRGALGITWQTRLPLKRPVSLPVESVLGGTRHGLSLLARVAEVGGLQLERKPLVETRFLYGIPQGRPLLSPGLPDQKPASYETALGRVLSPQFERKCFTCHGAPDTGSGPDAGVRCEHCHGAGAGHFARSGAGAIVNPGKLANAARIELCGRCHADGRQLADPMPEDLLISNQADALMRSECYIQSGQGLSCTTCHDPHKDRPANDPRYVNACRSCHSAAAKDHAAICPVNAKSGCIGCHMPAQSRGSFRMVSHWIRVATRGEPARAPIPALASQVKPKRVFLRILTSDRRDGTERACAEVASGVSFFDVARRYSRDPSAISGGFLGALWLDQMEPALAAAAVVLRPGGLSPVIESRGKFILLQRQPRDFRWQADRLYLQAAELKQQGKIDDALRKNQQALEIYPTFLRSLLFLGMTAGEQGDRTRAVAVLEHATRLYPQDPGAQLNLGVAYDAAGRATDAIAAYRRAIDAEPDLISAYLNLGAAFLAEGKPEQAAAILREGIEVNPLSPSLYYNLSLAYERLNRSVEARRALAFAEKIDPDFVRRQARTP